MKSLLLVLFFARLLCAETPDDAEILAKLRTKLKGRDEHIERSIKRIGNRTLELEVLISSDGTYPLASQIFGAWQHYSNWALKNINKRPSGGEYFLLVRGMKVAPKDKSILALDLFVDLPIYRKPLEREFRIKTAEEKGVMTLTVESVLNEHSLLGAAKGFLKVFPAEGKPNRVWIYLNAKATLKNWLVYEALPEKLLTRESGERIQTVMENYLEEEHRRRSLVATTSDGVEAPKEKRQNR